MGKALKSIAGGVVLGLAIFATGGAGAGLFGAIAGKVGATLGVASLAASAITGGLYGAALFGISSLLKPKLPDLSSEFGREIQLNGDPVAPRKICYGEAWTAGTLRYRNTDGENNYLLSLVIVLAGHEIDSVTAIEADGEALTLDGNGAVTNPSKWASLMTIGFHLGSTGQAADSTLVSTFDDWTSDHRLRGCAYAVVHLAFDEEELNHIPAFRFKIKGRKVYDPRKDSTNGGSGSHRLSSENTWEWSDNAVLCANDFLRGVYLNPSGTPKRIAGLGVSSGRFDWSNVIAEANICDEDVDLKTSGTQKRYTSNGFIDPRQDHGANLRHFEVAMAGDITFADGKWRFFAGAYRTPTLHLEPKHFIGPLRHLAHKGESLRVDTAQGSYASASESGSVLDYPPVRLSSAVTGQERVFRLDLALVNNAAQAQRCAKLLLEREAAGKTITCTTSLYGLRAVPGETIQVSHPAFGLVEQDMRVIDVQLSMEQVDDKTGLVVDLTLEAGPESLYAWDAEETEIGAAPTLSQAQVPFPGAKSVFVATIYKRSATQPDTPAENSGAYNFTTQEITVPEGWSGSVLASDGNPLWASNGVFSIVGDEGTDETVTWTPPVKLVSDGEAAAAGNSSIVAQIFRRSASTPSTPTENDGSYNFDTRTLTPPSGWSASPPAADGNPLYISIGIFVINGTSGTDSTVTWSEPQILLSDFGAMLEGGVILNPSFEAGDTGWDKDEDWSIVEDPSNARFGSWVAKLTSGSSNQEMKSSHMQVAEGDRVLGMAFFKRTAGSGALGVRLDWRDASGTLIDTDSGNGVTSSSYQLSRVIAVAPANAVTVRLWFRQEVATGTSGYGDGAYMAIIPKDSDIDLSGTSGTVDTDQIEEDAVTTITSFEDDSVSLALPGAILSGELDPQGIDYTLVVTASCNVWISASPGSGNSEFFLRVNGNAVNLVNSQRVKVSSTAAPGERIMMQVEIPITPSDEAGLGVVALFIWERDNSSTNAEIRSLAMRAEAIKR